MSEPDAWDDEDFEPQLPVKASGDQGGGDKWEGEDEDDDVKDSWDQEDSDPSAPDPGKAIQVKKKKTLKDRIAEKEAKKKEEIERKRAEAEAAKSMTAEERIADKLRRQKLQEEADLKLACDAFGVSPDSISRIDNFIPVSKQDFETFETLLKEKITQFEHSGHYVTFLETLYRDLAVSLEPEDLKKLGSTLNTLANEKAKAQKGTKGKKKTKAPKLMTGKADNDLYTEDFGGGEFDDFI